MSGTAPLTWAQLAGLTLARQFPSSAQAGTGAEATAQEVAALLEQTGPIQAQTARAAFLGLAARGSGVMHAAITAAYEEHAIVRGTTLRGTVHTATAAQHVVLDAVTRIGQRPMYERVLAPEKFELEQLWSELDDFAAEAWRTPAELLDHLTAWLAVHDPSAGARLPGQQGGRWLGFGHGALVRRPLKGGWEGQGAPAYRTARVVLGDGAARDALIADPGETVRAVVRLHLGAHGPATRDDIAWWSGLAPRTVGEALEQLAGELTQRDGPEGRLYWDLPDVPAPRAEVGTHLLPEFDSLLCAYQPVSRGRFVTPEHHALIWRPANGLQRPPVLHGGRLVGAWQASGTGAKRSVAVELFDDATLPPDGDLAAAVERAATVMGWNVRDLEVSRPG